MNKRQKKKLKNRAGFFHYKDYKLRVKLLYHAIGVVMKSSVAYAFKSLMFEHFKGLLLGQVPKKIYTHRWSKALKKFDKSQLRRELEHPVSSGISPPTSVRMVGSPVSCGLIPSMSMRMVGDKIHSFSIDENSFKNGLKPDELAPPLPKGPFDGHKSMTSAKLSAIRENPEMVSDKLTIEHGDTDRMRRQKKYPDTNWPPEGTTVETTISDDGDTRVDVIKREGERDLRIVHQGLNADEPDPVVLSESAAEELSRRLENATCVVDLDNEEEPLVIVEGKGPDDRTPKGDINKLLKYRGHVAENFVKGGSEIEYPASATIDLRKAVGRYGNMSIKGAEEDVSGPIHLGPIDLGPTDGERIEEHVDDIIDQRRRFAGNSCEASALD